MLRKMVKQRLNAAADEILEFYGRTEADKEEELSLMRRNDRQLEKLEPVFNPKVWLRRADVQQLLVSEENVNYKLSPKLDQQDPKLLHTKEELWTNQDKEQFNCLKENVTTLPVTTAPLRDEDDEVEPQAPSSVQPNQSQTQGSREAEAGTNSPDEQVQTETDAEAFSPDPNTDRKTLSSSMSEVRNEVDDCDYENWQKPLSDSEPEREDSDGALNKRSAHESGINTDMNCNTTKKSLICLECGKRYHYRLSFQKHVKQHSGESILISKQF